ncbi:VCBS domain-containing protein [Pseudoduganella sp. R-34]|uniref:VCBS domain-containing protein n=1 Tax=Pseudoduganella sp. R-34 TaxID=3404062 RepID=UPI003CF00E88
MATITGTNGNDVLEGTCGNDTINSGNGDDCVDGGTGNDSLNGGAGNDTLDGGSGSDQVNGGVGNDTLIYNVVENMASGSRDVYTGGAGVDIVKLQLSQAQWCDCDVRKELENYIQFLATVKINAQGEVSNGAASDFIFHFGSSTLTVQMMEKLVVEVQSAKGDYAPVDYRASLISGNVEGTVIEAGGVSNANIGTPNATGVLHADDLDGVDDSFQAVAYGTASYGNYSVDAHGKWSYSLNNANTQVQSLAVGDSITDSFTVSSADGTSQLIKITITGNNDAPVVSAALASEAAEGNERYAVNLLAGASDADRGETATLKVVGVRYCIDDGQISSGLPPGLSLLDGQLSVDAAGTAFNHIAAGAHSTIAVSYNIMDAHGAVVAQRATITITGTNDAPVVTGTVTGAAAEDGAKVTLYALADSSDVDDGTTLTIVSVPNTLPPGVSYNSEKHEFTLDTSHVAYQSLAAGQTKEVVVSFGVSDGLATVAESVKFIVTGTNDAPVVTAQVTGTAMEDGGLVTVDALANASDVDQGATLSVTSLPTELPAGVSYIAGSHSFTLDPTDAAYQSLAQGQTKDVVVNFEVTDGMANVAQSVKFTITGTNDAPVVTAQVTATAMEDGGLVTVDALANASDVDQGATLSVTSLPTELPAGVSYIAGSHSFTLDPTNAAYQSLAQGQTKDVVVNFEVTDGMANAAQSVKFTVTGTNDAPVVTAQVTGAAMEDGGLVTVDALANASDVDQGATLSVTSLPTELPAGVSYIAGSHSFTLDPTDAAYQSLAQGQTKDVVVNFEVTDGMANVAQSVKFTVTGTNDAPVVTAQVTGTAMEDGGLVTVDALTNASDVDQGATLSVTSLPTELPAGVSYIAGSHSFTLDPTDAAYQSLAQGQTKDVVVNFEVTDGMANVAQSVKFTVTGTNDAPVVTAQVTGTAMEDGGLVTVDALTNASDVDQGATLSVTSLPTELPAGVSYIAGSHSFTLDPTNAAYQSLAQGQTKDVVVNFEVTDGMANAAQSVKFTVTGTNDAPVVTAQVTGAAMEDGGLVTVNALANASDVDQGATLSVTSLPTELPAGVSYIAGSHSFTLDPTNAAYQSLAQGQTKDVVISFEVTDGMANVAQSVKFTVTGTNDAPVVTAQVTATAMEDGGLVTVNALANASDVDQGTTLSVVPPLGELPAGVSYIAASHSFTLDPTDAAYQSLAQGQTKDVVVSFEVTDGMANVAQSVKFTVTGTNDAPVVTAQVTGTAMEDGGLVTVDALTNASDVDQGAMLSVVPPLGELPAGVSYIAGSHSFTLDPTNAAYQSLAQGQTKEVVISFEVTDGMANVAQSVKFTVTGTNDAPVVTAQVTATAMEDGGLVTVDALANASDVDQGATLSVTSLPTELPAGVSYIAGSHSFTLDPTNAAYQSLAQGQTKDVVVNFEVTDGMANAAQSVKFTVTGTNDAPVVTAQVTGAAMEDGGLVTVNALANASDVDQGATLSVTSLPTELPAGVSYIAGSHSFTLDPTNAAYQSLAQGQTKDVVISFEVTDGMANVAQSVKFTVTGTNDAPVVTAQVTATAMEDGGLVTVDALANASDVDQGAMLSVVPPLGELPAGVSYIAASHSFTLDPTHAAYQGLAVGQTKDVVINYGVFDGMATVAQSAKFTITGTDDAPVAMADTIFVSTNTAVSISVAALLGNDTDIDGHALTITNVDLGVGIDHLNLNTNTGMITFDSLAGTTPGGFQYTVSDGAGRTSTGAVTINFRSIDAGNGNSHDEINLSSESYQASYIDGGSGPDSLTGGDAGDVIIGGASNSTDTLIGSVGNDFISGGDGNDDLSGGDGNDVLRGGNGNDKLDGGAGSEDMLDFSDGGTALNFTLGASTGTSNAGGLGNDTYSNMEGVIGTSKADIINGSSNNDVIRGSAGDDVLDGKGGSDLLDFSDGTAGISFQLVNNGANTFFDASAAGLGKDKYSGFEGVIGTGKEDTLTGSNLNDQLRGGGGDDVINGMDGSDRIVGGAGADLLTGGAGNDIFVFDASPNAVDLITDFNASGTGANFDMIELSRSALAGITTMAGSTLSASEFVSFAGTGASGTVDASVRVIYDSVTGNLYFDADGQGAANRTLFATLTLNNPGDTFDQNDIKVGS